MAKIVKFIKASISSVISTLKKTFTFAGRAGRFEYWIYQLAVFVFTVVAGLIYALLAGSVLGAIFGIILGIIYILLLIPGIALFVRRLHDVNLSGFWFWYLTSTGLGLIYVVYILGLDKSTDRFVERINKVGSPWLGWILALLTWGWGSPIAMLLILLYKGTQGENDYGPEATCPCCCCEK